MADDIVLDEPWIKLEREATALSRKEKVAIDEAVKIILKKENG
jgi:hypothetical protein